MSTPPRMSWSISSRIMVCDQASLSAASWTMSTQKRASRSAPDRAASLFSYWSRPQSSVPGLVWSGVSLSFVGNESSSNVTTTFSRWSQLSRSENVTSASPERLVLKSFQGLPWSTGRERSSSGPASVP